MHNAELLNKAKYIYEYGHEETRGPEWVTALAHSGRFNHMEIAAITRRPPSVVKKITDKIGVPPYRFGDKFDPKTLDALALISVHFYEHGTAPAGLVRLAAKTTSIATMSRLTGVPIDSLADAVQS